MASKRFFCTFDLKSFRTEFLWLSRILFYFRMGLFVLLVEIILGFRKAFFLASERNYFWLPIQLSGFKSESFRAPQWNHFQLLNEMVLGLQIELFNDSELNLCGLPKIILLYFRQEFFWVSERIFFGLFL